MISTHYDINSFQTHTHKKPENPHYDVNALWYQLISYTHAQKNWKFALWYQLISYTRTEKLPNTQHSIPHKKLKTRIMVSTHHDIQSFHTHTHKKTLNTPSRTTHSTLYEWVVLHIWMSNGTHMNESWHTYGWDTQHSILKDTQHSDRKKPPPPGGFPIYYVPSLRTVCKRTPLEEPGINPSRGVLLHTVLMGEHSK